MITSSENAVVAKSQHKAPCHDCPMRRNSLPGWLGGASPREYVGLCHGDFDVACHAIQGALCAGVAIYRANVAKSPKFASFSLPSDQAKVFATPMEFLDWHGNVAESFKALRRKKERKSD